MFRPLKKLFFYAIFLVATAIEASVVIVAAAVLVVVALTAAFSTEKFFRLLFSCTCKNDYNRINKASFFVK